MALNKTILKKVDEKTRGNKNQKDFIVAILEEENKGIGHYKKFYKEKVEQAVKDGD